MAWGPAVTRWGAQAGAPLQEEAHERKRVFKYKAVDATRRLEERENEAETPLQLAHRRNGVV